MKRVVGDGLKIVGVLAMFAALSGLIIGRMIQMGDGPRPAVIVAASETGNLSHLDRFRSLASARNLDYGVMRQGFAKAAANGNLKEWLEENRPDIILFHSGDIYRQAMEQGLLVPLDSMLERDGVDLDPLAPAAVQWLRLQASDRQLYGLPVGFQTNALLYNTEWFDQLGIPYPPEKGTWFDYLQLAREFSQNKEQVYGLSLPVGVSPFELILEIGRTEELALFDPDSGMVLADSGDWKRIWQEVLLTYQAGVMGEYEYLFTGNTAMAVPVDFAKEFGQARGLGRPTEAWRASFYPINEENPDHNHHVRVEHSIAIYAGSDNPEKAWEFLKLFVLENRIALWDMDGAMGLPARNSLILLENDRVFREVMPKADTIPLERRKYSSLYQAGEELFQRLRNGELSLDQALAAFKAELERLLRGDKP